MSVYYLQHVNVIEMMHTDHVPDFFYKDTDFSNVNLTEILKKSKSEEMFQFIDVYAGGGYTQLYYFLYFIVFPLLLFYFINFL